MKELSIVEVIWFDAQAGFSSPVEISEIINDKPILTKSVGYLIHKDEEKIILGFMGWGEESFKHWQMIPMGMVKEIRYLKKLTEVKEFKKVTSSYRPAQKLVRLRYKKEDE